MEKNCGVCALCASPERQRVIHSLGVKVVDGKAHITDTQVVEKYRVFLCSVSHTRTRPDYSCSFFKAPKWMHSTKS